MVEAAVNVPLEGEEKNRWNWRSWAREDYCRLWYAQYDFTSACSAIAMRCFLDELQRPARGVGATAGCTFGYLDNLSPDHLFCGGNLEFLS